MLMVDICVMILNKTLKLTITFSILLLVNSCGSIKEYVGLTDEDAERELINSTPELVLPPDFGKRATKSGISNKKSNFVDQSQMSFMPSPQTVQPRVSNFIAPDFSLPSSKTPSDSLEQFKQNRRFTIGEWVYGEYVQGYKEGNIYYKPVYDKGYNFSRRYLPSQNINSFRAPIQQPFGYFTPQQPPVQEFSNKPETNIENFGDLPILE